MPEPRRRVGRHRQRVKMAYRLHATSRRRSQSRDTHWPAVPQRTPRFPAVGSSGSESVDSLLSARLCSAWRRSHRSAPPGRPSRRTRPSPFSRRRSRPRSSRDTAPRALTHPAPRRSSASFSGTNTAACDSRPIRLLRRRAAPSRWPMCRSAPERTRAELAGVASCGTMRGTSRPLRPPKQRAKRVALADPVLRDRIRTRNKINHLSCLTRCSTRETTENYAQKNMHRWRNPPRTI